MRNFATTDLQILVYCFIYPAILTATGIVPPFPYAERLSMPFYFTELCLRSDEDYALLRRRTDACARLGRSYEIPCKLPDNCIPGDAFVGFCRTGEQYALYVRPQVHYAGTCAALTELFSPGVRSFSSFSDLTARLRLLGQALNAPLEPSVLYRQLKNELENRILGQDAAVDAAAFRLYTHLCKVLPSRPLSLVLYGPTGVGKSELGKAIAPILQSLRPEQNWSCVWTELNTFTQPHSAYRLIGSPPGYVGYDDPPILESVRQNSHTVFVFDELDKAHPEVWKVFMSILDEGRCSARRADEQGQRELDFRSCIFVFTTNLDLSAPPGNTLGFAPPPAAPTVSLPACVSPIRQLLTKDESARRAMIRHGAPAEIACRFTSLIGFRTLDETDRLRITIKQIASLGREFGLHIVSVSPAAAAALTPQNVVSVRSTSAVLEGVLTPIFAAHISRGGAKNVHLSGDADSLTLISAEFSAS